MTLAFVLVLGASLSAQQTREPAAPVPRDLRALLASEPAKFGAVLEQAKEHRLQILVGEPFVDADGRVRLCQSSLGEPRQYFYPASTVKLGGAIAALLELQRVNADGAGMGLDAEWAIQRRFPGDHDLVVEPIPIRRDLRRLFLVSDNAAFNHCFEFVGPRRLNETLWQAGLRSARIWHRLSEPHPLLENRQTRQVMLQQGQARFCVPPREVPIDLDNSAFTELEIGRAHRRDGARVDEPMSFAQKNAIALADLQALLVAVVRPEIDMGHRGFPDLSVSARAFVVQALGELPRESVDPVYAETNYPDHLCKFVLPGVRRVIPAEHVRVYDKIGRAYGFTIENAWIEDLRTGRGFFLAAVLYTNPDGVIGDDAYGYAEIADPFFTDLGEVITRAVLGSAAK